MDKIKYLFNFILVFCLAFPIQWKAEASPRLQATDLREAFEALIAIDSVKDLNDANTEKTKMDIQNSFLLALAMDVEQYNAVIFELLGLYVIYPPLRGTIDSILTIISKAGGESIRNEQNKTSIGFVALDAVLYGLIIVSGARSLNFALNYADRIFKRKNLPQVYRPPQQPIPPRDYVMPNSTALPKRPTLKLLGEIGKNWASQLKNTMTDFVKQCVTQTTCLKYISVGFVQSASVGTLANSHEIFNSIIGSVNAVDKLRVYPLDVLRVVQTQIACNTAIDIKSLAQQIERAKKYDEELQQRTYGVQNMPAEGNESHFTNDDFSDHVKPKWDTLLKYYANMKITVAQLEESYPSLSNQFQKDITGFMKFYPNSAAWWSLAPDMVSSKWKQKCEQISLKKMDEDLGGIENILGERQERYQELSHPPNRVPPPPPPLEPNEYF